MGIMKSRGEKLGATESDDRVAVGERLPILCPVCGGPTRRIRRTPIDRVVSVIFKVWRFRCASAVCSWEGTIHMKPRHFRQMT